MAPPTYVVRLSVKSVWVSSRKGFLEECLILKIATFNFRFLNESCVLIAEKALERDSGEISVGRFQWLSWGLRSGGSRRERTICRGCERGARRQGCHEMDAKVYVLYRHPACGISKKMLDWRSLGASVPLLGPRR